MTHPLRSFRSEASLTLDALAERVDVSKGQLSKIENGKSLPSLDLVGRLISASGGKLSANDFLPVAGGIPCALNDAEPSATPPIRSSSLPAFPASGG